MTKKYRVIAKIENEKFVKYKCNNLLKFASFLDTHFNDWRWFNVYEYKKDGNGVQLANFTKFNRPTRAYI